MPDEMTLRSDIRPKLAGVDLERAIVRLAERQHGVIARGQLLALGLGASTVKHRVGHGRLHPMHRGVYALGHRRLSVHGRFMAAVLAAGPGAVLSHRSAAELWGIRASASQRVEVSAPTRRRAGRGVRAHLASLANDELTELEEIPVTTASRTLLDLAAVLDGQRLERALREAEFRRLGDATSLTVLLKRHPRRRGTALLRRILAAGRLGDGVTRGELEDCFVAFLDAAGLPRPGLNRHIEAAGRLIECDSVWRDGRLIVELDGHATHGRRSAFEDDRARDRALSAAGWRVVRVTWRQLEREAGPLESDLRRLLGEGEAKATIGARRGGDSTP